MLRDKLGRFIRQDQSLDFFRVNGKLSLTSLVYLASLFPASMEMLQLNNQLALIIYLLVYAVPYLIQIMRSS